MGPVTTGGNCGWTWLGPAEEQGRVHFRTIHWYQRRGVYLSLSAPLVRGCPSTVNIPRFQATVLESRLKSWVEARALGSS